ncbi:MAG: class I SAM-dependent methyltransferase [Rhodobacteraceae bacterium]|nr:class I SAM-dependent methyltransferase [Paracoccaceae bacterium]
MVDMERRTALATASAAIAAATTGSAAAKTSGPSRDVKIDPNNLTDAQKKMLGIRFRKLDPESHLDFVTGFRRVLGRQGGSRASAEEVQRYLKSKGVSAGQDTDLSHEDSWNLMVQNGPYAAQLRLMCSIQSVMWDRASRALHADRHDLLAALEKSDVSGPGKLELDPDLEIPDTARHEIHQQPGGYCGDPLGGFVYHHAVTQGFRAGTADHDENHIEYTQAHAKPTDGMVNRILDIGCGTGQSTTPMKMRFPDAEVWGLEVGAPMIRYAHYRAAKMGLDVNFRHALAENTKFPDNHFDLVTDHLLFHEVAPDRIAMIVPEIFRILRPGGVFSHHDLLTEGHPTIQPSHTVPGKARLWETRRHNNYETHYLAYSQSDFPEQLRKAGFEVSFPPPTTGTRHVTATKPA